MAPTPPNTVMRLKAHYQGPLGSHTMLFHAPTMTPSEFAAAVRFVIQDLTALQWNGTTWDRAEVALAGNNFFFPIDWTPITVASVLNPQANDTVGEYLEFGGRSVTGKRVKLYLFESILGITPDMRYLVTENEGVNYLVTTLNAQVDLTAIDGSSVSWYNYANYGINDYWTKRARRG